MAERVLTRRALNRALLARQLLLERERLSVVDAVERLAGLQAQHTSAPYLQLWTRLDGFERDELARALEARSLVKALLMRGTLHIVTAADYWAYAVARQDGTPAWPAGYERFVPTRRIEELAATLTADLRRTRRTLPEILATLAADASGPASAAFLWRTLQRHGHFVHVPPSGLWGYHKGGHYAAADAWVDGEPPAPPAALDLLVRRYLGAFGPATEHDVARWAGITRVTPIRASLARLAARTYRNEEGRLLYDLPDTPLPDPDTPPPPRLVARYDNLLLAHVDRTRILADVPATRVIATNGLVHATILVDGFVAGTWRLENGRVVLEPFGRLERDTRAALEAEAKRVEHFMRT